MNITTGKHVIIETGDFTFKRTAETPGGVTVHRRPISSGREPEVIGLPAQRDAAERFIAAYRRIIAEDVEYRTSKWENTTVEPDVHTEHCCFTHGCKYGDANCTVASGGKPQSSPCETCDLESEGYFD